MLAQYHIVGKSRAGVKRNIQTLRKGHLPQPEKKRALTAAQTLGLLQGDWERPPLAPYLMFPGHWHKHRSLRAKGKFPGDLPGLKD